MAALTNENTCPQILAAFVTGAPRRVRITCTGLAGDSATIPDVLLFQTGRLRAQFADADVFDVAMNSREVHHIPSIATITDDAGCKTYCVGILNRDVVPAFMPRHRNEDGTFAAMLFDADVTALAGHLPIGVVHDSHRPTSYGIDALRHAKEVAVSELLIAYSHRVSTTLVARTPADRLRAIGRAVRDAGALPAHDLADLVADTIIPVRCGLIRNAYLAVGPSPPEAWKARLDYYTSVFEKAVCQEAFLLPAEFSGRGVKDGFEDLATFLDAFGRLLEAWPDIWELSGISGEYEPPDAPELVIDTEYENVEQSIGRLRHLLSALMSPSSSPQSTDVASTRASVG
jgi:hypothetical protein